MSSRRAKSSLLPDGLVVDDFFIRFLSHDGPDHAAIDTERRPVGGRGPGAAHINDDRRHFLRGREPPQQRGGACRAEELPLHGSLVTTLSFRHVLYELLHTLRAG